LLQSIYGQFTEGFGTPDLIHAEALLEGLRPNSLEKVAKNRLTWSRRNYLRSPRIVAARLSRLKSKARPAERHLGVLWKPQRFIQLRIVKNVPEMIDDLAISSKLIRKHKLDRSQHECEKCVVAVQQRGFYRRRTDEIA
jgi:hypothetical protein